MEASQIFVAPKIRLLLTAVALKDEQLSTLHQSFKQCEEKLVKTQTTLRKTKESGNLRSVQLVKENCNLSREFKQATVILK